MTRKGKIFGLTVVMLLVVFGFTSSLTSAQDFSPNTDPLPYEELDVEEVRKAGYAGHHEVNCAYGAFNAIISPLQEKIGSPYDQIPTYMMTFGGGGIRGQESICGAVLGSIAAINLIAGEDFTGLVDELMEYYATEPLPTDISNQYAVNNEYPVETGFAEPLEQSVAGSIDCDVSKEKWLEIAEYPEHRNERCHRLTGDIAAKAAELLNEWHATRDEIADYTTDFEQIFADAEFVEIDANTYEVLRNNEVVGYIGLGSGEGAAVAGGNEILMAVGVDLNGNIEGVEVLDHSETPAYASEFTEEEWLAQFAGLSVEEDIYLEEDTGAIEVISGATQTCDAATNIVREELNRLKNYIN